jgi:serine/threonine protein kinase
MIDKKFQRFGKYLILDHMEGGGMAKICRARYLGEQAKKMVAIKMVQPQYSNDETFVRMFQDELNITFGMVHPNIMQVYDYGKINGQLYTAMEYIHGANLKQFVDRIKEKKKVFPVETCCYIISQVCLGLHYAHTFTDKLTGKPYKIVHRDISPHNIMLTYDGAVKVIDFGIAKANTNSELTQVGTIKGKLTYLAPEYLDGLVLDARYDEFAVGITLWELLCSKKLFQANNDLAVLKQIQACKIVPPSQINPLVPKELDEIVLKALSKDRSHRYDNLDQMNRALVRFLYSTYPDFNPSDLKDFSHDLFKVEISKDDLKFVEYGNIDIQSYIHEMKEEENRTGKFKKAELQIVRSSGTKEPGREKVRELEMDIQPLQVEIGNELLNISSEKNSTRKVSKTALQSKQISKNTLIHPSSSGTKINSRDRNSESNADRENFENNKDRPHFFPAIVFFIAASFAAVFYYNGDLTEELFGFNLAKINMENTNREVAGKEVLVPSKSENNLPLEERNLPNIDESQKPVIVKEGQIIFGGMDVEMELTINDEKFENHGRPIFVELNKKLNITVNKSGYLPFSTSVILDSEKNSHVVMIPPLEKARKGLLTASQNYTPGSKLIYTEGGETKEREIPFTDVEVLVGIYEGKVVNPIIGTEKKVEFIIDENKKHVLE